TPGATPPVGFSSDTAPAVADGSADPRGTLTPPMDQSPPRTAPPPEPPPAEPPAQQPQSATRSSVRSAVEWVVIVVAALLAALLIKTFLLQAFYIPSDSMNPTLVQRDRVLVNKLSYHFHDVHR